MIFDEVMTGFRVAYGGAQSLFGISGPDDTGKDCRWRLPMRLWGSSRHHGSRAASRQGLSAGTLSGNPLATAAGIATLKELRDRPPYERLEAMAARLAQGLDDAATAAGVPHTVARVGSMMTLFFNPRAVTDWSVAAACDTRAFAHYFWRLLARGYLYAVQSGSKALYCQQPIKSRGHSDLS